MSINLERFYGSHFEIGSQQGQCEVTRKCLEHIPEYDMLRRMKPRYIPTSLFLFLAKRRASNLLKSDVFEYYPKQAQRLRGIADGAGTDVSTILFGQSMELLLTVSKSSYQVPACTSISFKPQITREEELIVAKNFDYPNELKPYHLTCHTKPEEGYQTLGCTVGPLPGILEGMNEHGLTVTYNLAYSTEIPKYYVPLSMVLQEMLETCKNTREAIEFMVESKRAGGALLTIADPEGDVITVDTSHNHLGVKDHSGEPIVIATNHYLTLDMQKYEVPRNAVYSQTLSKGLVGVRVHESSEQRMLRVKNLLKDEERIDEQVIKRILSDHGENDEPSNLTPCQHGEFLSTTRSMILYPERRVIKVLYGNPCKNEYVEFSFT